MVRSRDPESVYFGLILMASKLSTIAYYAVAVVGTPLSIQTIKGDD